MANIDPSAHRIDTHAIPRGIEPYPLEFTGSGGEYFKVWIVNLLLGVVTLGFYTPFARRRTAQYFYGHTDVAGSPLEFTVQQKRMVVGFILLVVLYAAFRLAAETGQDLTVALFMFGGAAAAPYFWGSAMRFRLNATRWRGVRLQFTASWGEVYKASWPVFAIALAWFVVTVVAGVLVPEMPEGAAPQAADAAMPQGVWGVLALGALALVATFFLLVRLEFNYKSLLVERSRIGGEAGRWKPVYGDFVRVWLATLGVFLLCLLVVTLAMVAILGTTTALAALAQGPGLAKFLLIIALGVASILLLFLVSAPARAYREARMFQLVWNNVGVSQVARFKCDLNARRYTLLRLKNVFLSLFTLGFYRPFALVSEYRMKTESVTLHVKGGLDQLAGQLARDQEGLGDAIADAVGLNLVG